MKRYEVIYADLDGTLIDTISGSTFPKGIWDMKIKFDVLDAIKKIAPECLLIVTNQGGIESGFVNERNFQFKMEYLCRSIKEYTGIHTEYSYCTSNDKDNLYRKPNIGMVDSLMKRMIKNEILPNGIHTDYILMIGDASGKPVVDDMSDKELEKLLHNNCYHLKLPYVTRQPFETLPQMLARQVEYRCNEAIKKYNEKNMPFTNRSSMK